MKWTIVMTVAAFLIVSPAWAAGPAVTVSTSGNVTFSAGNPTAQPVTPATSTLVVTVDIPTPKNGHTWDLTIRGAGSNFTGTSGAPIPVSNVQWTASAAITHGTGSASAASGQGLTTSDIVAVSGLQGKNPPFTIQVTFNLTVNNSWNFDADTYLQNLVLTATAN